MAKIPTYQGHVRPADVRISNPPRMPTINVGAMASKLMGARIPLVKGHYNNINYGPLAKTGESLFNIANKMQEDRNIEMASNAVFQAQKALGTAKIEMLANENMDPLQYQSNYTALSQKVKDNLLKGLDNQQQRDLFSEKMQPYDANSELDLLQKGLLQNRERVKSGLQEKAESIVDIFQTLGPDEGLFQKDTLDKELKYHVGKGTISEEYANEVMTALEKGVATDSLEKQIAETPQLAVERLKEGEFDQWYSEDWVQQKISEATAGEGKISRENRIQFWTAKSAVDAQVANGDLSPEDAFKQIVGMGGDQIMSPQAFATQYDEYRGMAYTHSMTKTYGNMTQTGMEQAHLQAKLAAEKLDPVSKRIALEANDTAFKTVDNMWKQNPYAAGQMNSPQAQQLREQAQMEMQNGNTQVAMNLMGQADWQGYVAQKQRGIDTPVAMDPAAVSAFVKQVRDDGDYNKFQQQYEQLLQTHGWAPPGALMNQLIEGGLPEQFGLAVEYNVSPADGYELGEIFQAQRKAGYKPTQTEMNESRSTVESLLEPAINYGRANGSAATADIYKTEVEPLVKAMAYAKSIGREDELTGIVKRMMDKTEYADGGRIKVPYGQSAQIVDNNIRNIFSERVMEQMIPANVGLAQAQGTLPLGMEHRNKALIDHAVAEGKLMFNPKSGNYVIQVPMTNDDGLMGWMTLREAGEPNAPFIEVNLSDFGSFWRKYSSPARMELSEGPVKGAKIARDKASIGQGPAPTKRKQSRQITPKLGN